MVGSSTVVLRQLFNVQIGASVTMPHKISIMQYLDQLTEEAREVGACNTIFLRDIESKRVTVGANTDVVGIREALIQNVPRDLPLVGTTAMVIGSGGAARSAVYTLRRWLRCDPIYLVNRDQNELDELMRDCESQRAKGVLIPVTTVEYAEELQAPSAIVACVPDLNPITMKEQLVRRIAETFLKKAQKGVILDMCYHPSPWTRLATIAKMHQWQVILGTEALIWQGLEQDRYWTGLPLEQLPITEVKAVIAKTLREEVI